MARDERPGQGRRDRRGTLREVRERGARDPRSRFDLRFWLWVLVALLAFRAIIARRTTAKLSHSGFLALAEEGAIERHLEGVLTMPLEDGRERLVTIRVDPEPAEELGRAGCRGRGADRVEPDPHPAVLGDPRGALRGAVVLPPAPARGLGGPRRRSDAGGPLERQGLRRDGHRRHLRGRGRRGRGQGRARRARGPPARHAGRGPGARGLDRAPRGGGLGPHHPATDRGPLPDDGRGADGQDGGGAGRPRRGADRVRASEHRGRRRPPEGPRHRALDGGALRHVRAAGPRRLRTRPAGLPRPARCGPARARRRRAGSDRRRGPPAGGRGDEARDGALGAPPRRARAHRARALGEGDPGGG